MKVSEKNLFVTNALSFITVTIFNVNLLYCSQKDSKITPFDFCFSFKFDDFVKKICKVKASNHVFQ